MSDPSERIISEINVSGLKREIADTVGFEPKFNEVNHRRRVEGTHWKDRTCESSCRAKEGLAEVGAGHVRCGIGFL